MKPFVIASLFDQQHTLLRLMERSRRAGAPESATLDWALETVVTGIRDLREDRISWQQAAQVYQSACAVEHECELALLFPVINLDVPRKYGEIGL